MHVADIMQTNVKAIGAADLVGEAIAALAEHHVSGLPVVDEGQRLVGVLSNSDILQALAEHPDPEERDRIFEHTEVRELMTPRPQTVTPEATVKDAAQRMLYLEVHRLFVEREGRLAGVISTTDLVRAMAGMKV